MQISNLKSKIANGAPRVPIFLILLLLSCVGATAQRSFDGIANDYGQVGIVAHVKITDVRLSAPDVHPLFEVKCVIIERFKGQVRIGRSFKYYFHAEKGRGVTELIGQERIVFLEGKLPIPSGGEGWYELENSWIRPTKALSRKLRRLRGK